MLLYPDTAIWLQLPDTSPEYPVMLGEDSVHLIVSGYNGSDGTMFALLRQYESQDCFLGHKTPAIATSDAEIISIKLRRNHSNRLTRR